MAEVIGLAASAVTLAALFSNCIDCFSYFKAAQNCSAEAETLLVKLDCEKTRLLVWANTVGILRTDSQRRHPQLAGLEQEILIRRCIDQIIGLLTDGQKLQAEYGGRPTAQPEIERYVAVMSVNSMNIFKTAKRRFFARAGGLTETPNWLSRIKWAIRDGAKFRILLLHLRDFVDNIIQLVPVPPDVINSTVEGDITTIIDISTLRLAESACEENYPSWSTRASEVIKESEIGTLDRRNFEEMIRDTDEPEIAKEFRSNTKQNLLAFDLLEQTFVVLTDKCLDLEADSHCEAAIIGRAVSGYKDLSFTCKASARWNLGRRILSNLMPFQSHEEMRDAESWRFNTSKITGNLPRVRPACRVYIQCGPCACAIQTALRLTQGEGVSEYFEFAIRIDERLPTSCRRSSTTVDVLAAIRDSIDGHVVEEWSPSSKSIGFIDCPQLEKQIHNLEGEKSGHLEPASILQTMFDRDNQDFEGDLPTGAIIVIAEADLCQPSLESRPFYSEARKPRETDILAFTYHSTGTRSSSFMRRKYTGSYTRSENAIEKKKAELSLLKEVTPPPMSSVMAMAPPLPRSKRPRSESAAESDSQAM